MTLKKMSFSMIFGLSLFSCDIFAATALGPTKHFFLDKKTTAADLNVRAFSWYNLSMGYLGWTHHSNWIFVNLKKGIPVKLKLTTEVDGLHPAATVWYRAGQSSVKKLPFMNGHSYKQFGDIYEANAQATDAQNKTEKIGNLIMRYVTNGFDRDGMTDSDENTSIPSSLPQEYDQSQLNRVMDGVSGQLEISFTPPENGWYQIAVGAINPDTGSTAYGTGPGAGAGPSTEHPIHVEISGQ